MFRSRRKRTFHFCLAAAIVSGLPGCSVHPLPDDVSRVSTVDIVRNIRCEAKKGLIGFEGDKAAQFIIATSMIGFDFEFDIEETNSARNGVRKFGTRSAGHSEPT